MAPDAHERLRSWPERNPELWWAQQKRYYEVDKRRGYPNSQQRRAMAHGAFVEYVAKKVVYELSEGTCALCGAQVDFKDATLDHIYPLSRGGSHAYANIQLAHGTCNRRKSNKLPEEYAAELAA